MVNTHEDEMMTEIITALRAEYSTNIFITDSESNDNNSKFPCVCFYKNNDYITSSYRTMNVIEVAITEFYTADIYADDSDTCKNIASIIDEVMQSHFYQRTLNQPLFNIDVTLSRRMCRWRGTHIKEQSA